MVTKHFTPVLAKRIRVTKLDECGFYPAAGTEKSQIATNGFVSVSLSVETEEGAEIMLKRADGSLYVNEKYSDSFKRFNVEMQFAGVNPSLLALATNAKEYEDYAMDVAGITIGEGLVSNRFGLELWTGLGGQACVPGQEAASGYGLLPHVNAGMIGDLEFAGEDAVSFAMSGAYTRGPNSWGVGPYKVVKNNASTPVAAALPTALDPFDHLLLMSSSIAPPPIATELGAMPAAA